MTGPSPKTMVTISDPQQAVLEALLRQASCSQALALRVRIVLGAAAGQTNQTLADTLPCTLPTVRTWRWRWAANEAHLAVAEDDPQILHRTIATVLADAPRPGTPDTFTAEHIVLIVNLACTPPEATGRPITAWTPREFADEAVKQGIVPRISPQSVARFLKSGRSLSPFEPLLAQRENQRG